MKKNLFQFGGIGQCEPKKNGFSCAIDRFGLILYESDDAITVQDFDGQILAWNKGAEKMYGYLETEIIGANIRQIVPAGNLSETETLLRQLSDGLPSRSFETKRKAKDGRILDIWLTLTLLKDATGRIDSFSTTERDITELKRLEGELKSKAGALELSLKETERANQAKGEFLATMNHEFRTPLGIIVGFSEWIIDHDCKPQETLEYCLKIKKSALHLKELVDDFLDISRIEAGKLKIERKEASLFKELDEIGEILRKQAELKKLTFEFEIDKDLPPIVNLDSIRVRQILFNLVGNGIKFTETGGIVVKVSGLASQDSSNYLLKIVISDSGIGIDVEKQKDLFVPFSQVSGVEGNRYGGSGLGLYLCRKLANAMGGDVNLVASSPGEGSCFSVTIPMSVPMVIEPVLAKPKKGKESLQSLVGYTILVVDDCDELLILTERFLSSAGATVDMAHSGLEAIQMARDKVYDVVLMDVEMPGMNGLATIGELRKLGINIPVIAATGRTLSEEKEQIFRAGFNGYIAKPYGVSTLLNTISEYKTSLNL